MRMVKNHLSRLRRLLGARPASSASAFLTALLLPILLPALCLSACGQGADGGGLTSVTLNEVAHSIFYAPQ